MMRAMSDSEVAEQRERVSHLYQSKWLVDNLTAILMDMNTGSSGLEEGTARAKAHAITRWLEFKKNQVELAGDPVEGEKK